MTPKDEPDLVKRGKDLGRMIKEGVWRDIEESVARDFSGPPSAAKPEGIVTILFTDVEGSTDLVHALGDKRAHAVIRRHDAVLRGVFDEHGGVEVEHPGDSFMVAFPTATRAVECGVSLQPALDTDPEGETPLRVRVGMDTGEVIAEEDGYFGRTVFRASRIADLADGGQVLVSETTRLIAESGGFVFRDAGIHRLKGLGGSHPLYEVARTREITARERRSLPPGPDEADAGR